MLSESIMLRVSAVCVLILCLLACGCPQSARPGGQGGTGSTATGGTVAGGDSGGQSDVDRVLSAYTDEERELILSSRLIDESFIQGFIDDGLTDEEVREYIDPVVQMCLARAERPAGVVTGTACAWREVAAWESAPEPYMKDIYVGNFDGDADQEVLLFTDRPELVQLPGGEISAVEMANVPGYRLAWDFDGDGIDELLTGASIAASYDPAIQATVMDARNLFGDHVGYVRGHEMGPNIIRGDYDGDGLTDLFMAEESPYVSDEEFQAQAFGTGGRILFTLPPEWNSPYIIAGDVDGDGRDELVNQVYGELRIDRYDGDVDYQAVWDRLMYDYSPGWCRDINGDGCAEVMDCDGRVCDLANESAWQLELPPDWAEMYIDGCFGPNVFLVDLPEVPEAVMAAIIAEGGVYCETLAMWAADGSLVYCEYLGELADAFAVAGAGGRRHLVLLTRSRLLVWP